MGYHQLAFNRVQVDTVQPATCQDLPKTLYVFILGGVNTQVIHEDLKEFPRETPEGMTQQPLKGRGGIRWFEGHDPVGIHAPFGCKSGFVLIIRMYLHLIVTT